MIQRIILQVAATAVLALLVWGLVVSRRQPKQRHVTIVTRAIWLDIAVTLWHEVGLRAMTALLGVNKEKPEIEGLLLFHITISSVMFVMYLLVWRSGRQIAPAGWLKIKGPPVPDLYAFRNLGWLWALVRPIYGFLNWLLSREREFDYSRARRTHIRIAYVTVFCNFLSWFSGPGWILHRLIS